MTATDDAALLVTEIHHRVMNSFQVISALAARCGRVREIGELPPLLDDLADRLSAFAAVHRQLMAPPSGCFAEYCSTLGINLVAAFGRSDAVHVDMDAVDLADDRRARIALIVAELLTNCLKHSLRSIECGSIRLDLRVVHDRLVIEAQDSAAGPVAQPAPAPSRVVSALIASLDGEACVVDRDGYCARVSLPFKRSGGSGARRGREDDPVRSPATLLTIPLGSPAGEGPDLRH